MEGEEKIYSMFIASCLNNKVHSFVPRRRRMRMRRRGSRLLLMHIYANRAGSAADAAGGPILLGSLEMEKGVSLLVLGLAGLF